MLVHLDNETSNLYFFVPQQLFTFTLLINFLFQAEIIYHSLINEILIIYTQKFYLLI